MPRNSRDVLGPFSAEGDAEYLEQGGQGVEPEGRKVV